VIWMLMPMAVGVFVTVRLVPMRMLMRMRTGVIVPVQMLVLVFSFHDKSS
jgi:hypothetical protein